MEHLWQAMGSAKMSASGRQPRTVNKTNVGPHPGRQGSPGNLGFLGRYRELLEENVPQTAALELMVALVQAKTLEHQHHKGGEPMDIAKRKGAYLKSSSLCSEQWWASNVAAAEIHLAERDKPARAAVRPTEAVHRVEDVDGLPLTDDDKLVWDEHAPAGSVYLMNKVREARAIR